MSCPYALAPMVEGELDRLQKTDIIERVQYSEWAAPIVPVAKSDGSVRICGDYKLTVNPATKLNPYPIPRIEDIYASLAGGQQFTTMDSKHAYNQVTLAEESRDATTINTHRGLFRYKRLPLGVSSAPGICQCIIDTIVKDVPRICAYLDDILITGRDRFDPMHFETKRQTMIAFNNVNDQTLHQSPQTNHGGQPATSNTIDYGTASAKRRNA